MRDDNFLKLSEKYSEMFPGKNEGKQTPYALAFSLGFERAAEILEDAIRKNCRVKIIYGEGEDNVSRIRYIKMK